MDKQEYETNNLEITWNCSRCGHLYKEITNPRDAVNRGVGKWSCEICHHDKSDGTHCDNIALLFKQMSLQKGKP